MLQNARDTGCPAATERVEHLAARRRYEPHQVPHELDGLDRGVWILAPTTSACSCARALQPRLPILASSGLRPAQNSKRIKPGVALRCARLGAVIELREILFGESGLVEVAGGGAGVLVAK